MHASKLLKCPNPATLKLDVLNLEDEIWEFEVLQLQNVEVFNFDFQTYKALKRWKFGTLAGRNQDTKSC